MSSESPLAVVETESSSLTAEVVVAGADDQLGSVVQSHYNNLRQTDLKTRSESRIYYLRNFNNWIKSTIINEFLAKIRQEKGNNYPIGVHDLGCGKGGDILKWKKNNVARMLFSDIADVSLEECRRRFDESKRGSSFTGSLFVHLDATKDEIKSRIEKENEGRLLDDQQYDLVSTQFVIHYSFESYEQADQFMRNVSDTLKSGGYFIGTTTNAHEIVKRLRASDTNSFGNDIYRIDFNGLDKHALPLFGAKFNFQLDEVVECPEFLLNFEALVEIAKRYGMELIFKKSFSQMFDDYSTTREHSYLIPVIKALEPYFPDTVRRQEDANLAKPAEEYEHINKKLEDEEFKAGLGNDEYFATLSKSEWEAATLYLAFAFKKN